MFKKVFVFYRDGFKSQSKTSKRLWLIIIVKLIIMFAILKIFFFKDFLNSKAKTEEEKSQYIINKITDI